MDVIAELLARIEADALAAATDADLAEIEGVALDLFQQVRAGDVEGVSHDDVETLTRLHDAVNAVRAEAGSRIEAAESRQAEIARLEEALVPAADDGDDANGDDGDGEGGDGDDAAQPTEPTTPEPAQATAPDDASTIDTTAPAAVEPSADERAADAPAEPVTASPPLPSLSDLQARNRQPVVHETTATDRMVRLVSQGRDVPWPEFAQAVIETRESFLGFTGPGIEKVRIGRFDWRDEYPEARRLDGGDLRGNTAKIEALAAAALRGDSWDAQGQPTGALTASGGFCAPTPALYDLVQISGAQRPVRDSLMGFNADRGGIRFTTPPDLSDVLVDQAGGAVGEWDRTTDITPGENVKTTQVVPCGEVVERFVKAIYRSVQIGNFQTRAYPEWVAVWADNVMAAWARKAETELLDAIDAASTAVTQTQFFGTARDLFPSIVQLAVAERNRQRMTPDARLHVWIPAWIVGSIQMDLMHQGYTDFKVTTPETIRAYFGQVGVGVTFYEDTATGAGQIVAAQGAGNNMRDLPTTVRWYLSHEGAHVFLDGGTLDLGLIRDGALVDTNDYRMFAESFEGHAFRGIFSYKVDSSICPSGAGSLGEDSSGYCSGS